MRRSFMARHFRNEESLHEEMKMPVSSYSEKATLPVVGDIILDQNNFSHVVTSRVINYDEEAVYIICKGADYHAMAITEFCK